MHVCVCTQNYECGTQIFADIHEMHLLTTHKNKPMRTTWPSLLMIAGMRIGPNTLNYKMLYLVK